jgi:hypothetical protein
VSATAAAALAARRGAAAAPPRLLVWLIAEQFRGDYLDRYAPWFGPRGFRRLMSEGAYFPECRAQASAFSASGVATLATGAWPDTHGIVADRWFDRASRQTVEAALPLRQAPALADELLAVGGGSRAAALGLSGPLASLAAPSRGKPLVYLLEPEGAAPDEPVWLSAVRAAHGPERHAGAKWIACRADENSPPLRVLRQEPGAPEEFRALYRASPFAQAAQVAALRALLAEEKPGFTGAATLVTVVLSSTAALGYEEGGVSPLMRDLVLHLDVEIEQLLEALDRAPGRGNYNLVFSAAHGAPPLPAEEARGRYAISSEAVARAVDAALSARFDIPPARERYVDRYLYPFLYLRPHAVRRTGADPRAVRRLAGEAALTVPGVAAFYTADGDCSRGSAWRRRFQNSFHALRSGDVMLAYEAGAFENYAARGVAYGSLYPYDARVPLIFFGPSFAARTVEDPCALVDVAPTLARSLLIPPPGASIGRVLSAALAPDERTSR